MKVINNFAVVALSAVATRVFAQDPLNCYSCTENQYNANGDEDCWATNAATSTQACSTGQLCYSKITWLDGFPQSVTRGCVAPTSVQATVGINQDGGSNLQGCNVNLEKNSNEHEQVCGSVCDTDSCNAPASFTIKTLIACNCQNTGEFCDFLTGTCTCPAGQAVTNGACASTTTTTTTTPATTTTTTVATVAPLRQCLQCDSEIDGDACVTGSTSFLNTCDTGFNSCASATHIVVDADGNSVREVVTRGCSNEAAQADTCEFKAVEANYATATHNTLVAEIVCRYACTTDGCNSESATGDGPALVTAVTYDACAIGASVDGSGDTSSTACQYGCKSVLSYLEAPFVSEYHKGNGNPLDKIIKYERMCASEGEELVNSCVHAAVTANYNPTLNGAVIGASLDTTRASAHIFQCTKVCTGANCNIATAYPGRPTCYTCDSASDATCFGNLPAASQCNFDEDSCEIEHTGLDLSVEGSAALTLGSNFGISFLEMALGHVPAITRRCKNTYGTTFDATKSEDTDDGSYYCADHATSISAESNAGDRTLLKQCTYRCAGDNCNFGPGLIMPEIAPVVNTTAIPVTVAGSSSLAGSVALAAVLAVFSKWML